MCPAYDDRRLALVQRAYDAVLKDFEGSPDENIREGIASAILFIARFGQDDWQLMASYARTNLANIVRARHVGILRAARAA